MEERTQLLDLMVENGLSAVALLQDDDENKLFRGQVGHIQDVVLDKEEEKNFYYLEFTDFENENDTFCYCLVKKNLLPLFSVYPPLDDEKKTLCDLRNKWEKLQVPTVSTLNFQIEHLVHDKNRFVSSSDSFGGKKILIEKNFLFPLYFEYLWSID